MRIAGRNVMKEFILKNKDAQSVVKNFTANVSSASWKDSSDLRRVYPNTVTTGALHTITCENGVVITALFNFVRQCALINNVRLLDN